MRAVPQRADKDGDELVAPAPLATARPRILIADKSPVVRAGLEDYIRKDGRFEVIGSTANGQAFASLANEHKIDIGIVGWALPEIGRAHV